MVLPAPPLWPTKEYIWRQQANIAEYIADLPIYDIFTELDRVQVSIRLLRCWYRVFTQEEEGDGANEGAERVVR